MAEGVRLVLVSPERKRGALYDRVSTFAQMDGPSLLQQKTEGTKALDERYNADCVRVYTEAYSGEEYLERKVLQELLADIEKGLYDVVLFWDSFRLARDPDYGVMIRFRAEQAGCRIDYTSEPIKEDTWGKAIQYFQHSAGQEELRKIRRRTMDGKKNKALLEQKTIGVGDPPFGYQFTYGTRKGKPQKQGLKVDEAEARIVKWLFEETLSGRSGYSLASELTEQGVPSPRGGRYWHQSTISRILKSPVYKGEYTQWRWKTERNARGNKVSCQREKDEWIAMPEGSVEAIVTPEVYDAVQRSTAKNKLHARRNNRHPDLFLLRHHIRCGKCGHTVYCRVYKRQSPIYYCAQQVWPKVQRTCPAPIPTTQAARLDEQVWADIVKRLGDPELIRAELLAQHERGEDNAPRLAEIEQRIKEREHEQGNLAGHLRHFEPDEPAADTLRFALKETTEAIAKLRAIRDELLGRQEEWRREREQIEVFVDQIERVRSAIEGATFEERRLALRMLGVQVLLYDAGHEPQYEVIVGADGPIVNPASQDTPHNSIRLYWQGRVNQLA